MSTQRSKYPAKAHLERTLKVYEELHNKSPNFAVFISGEKLRLFPDSDMQARFRQNRSFNYLTGAFDVVDAHVLWDKKKLILYLPEIESDDVMWSGLPLLPDEAIKRFDVDEVRYFNRLKDDIKSLARDGISIHTIKSSTDGLDDLIVDSKLKEAIDEARVIKDVYEINILREACRRTAICHRAVMSALPIETNETHVHAEFIYHAIRQGSKETAYDPICCAGPHAGTLHYTRNDGSMEGQQIVLIDAGVEHEAYASDVTRCFPISGEWTYEARAIYDLVWKMQHETMIRIRPGVQWSDLHLLAHRILIEGLQELNILKSEYSFEELFDSDISAAFYPHGLGHMLGMDTHDTAGNANYNDPDPKLRYLRIRRALKAGMVVTVEPGCYFNDFLLDGFAKDKLSYVNLDILERYKPVGGIRIEDNVVVTSAGYENYTGLTSDADEVAKIVRDGLARDRKYFHNLV